MKLICIGRNYTKHIEELENEKPTDPVVFLKPDTAILLKKQPFFIPDFSNDVHHEVEVLVKINRVGKYIDKKFAHKYYDQIGLGIDFTARDLQSELKSKGLPWEKAKAFDGAAVVGNWLPKSKFENVNNINFSLHKNDELVQQGNTRSNALENRRIDRICVKIFYFKDWRYYIYRNSSWSWQGSCQ